jgi:hypothetical protein
MRVIDEQIGVTMAYVNYDNFDIGAWGALLTLLLYVFRFPKSGASGFFFLRANIANRLYGTTIPRLRRWKNFSLVAGLISHLRVVNPHCTLDLRES